MQEPIQSQPPAVIDGLEEFFVSPGDDDTSVTRQTDMVAVSVSEAAKLLGITERSIWRRIRAGKLQSELCDGKTIVNVRQSDAGLTTPTDVTDTPLTISTCQSDTSGHQLEKLLELLREKDRELQAATYRNGYLEAQLENQKEQIKLLTDSQHKKAWWARFCSWFAGSR